MHKISPRHGDFGGVIGNELGRTLWPQFSIVASARPGRSSRPGHFCFLRATRRAGSTCWRQAASKCFEAPPRSPSSAIRARCSAKCRCCSTGHTPRRSALYRRSASSCSMTRKASSNPILRSLSCSRDCSPSVSTAPTTYLVDLKRQFEGHGNHLGMVGEILESLIHQQHQDFTLGPECETDPRLLVLSVISSETPVPTFRRSCSEPVG